MNTYVVRSLAAARRFRPSWLVCQMSSGGQVPPAGSGAGKGGGAGGSVRESGGAFGEREAAQEEAYFRKLTSQQLDQLREHHVDEIRYLEKELKEHEEAISRHKKKLKELKKLSDKDD